MQFDFYYEKRIRLIMKHKKYLYLILLFWYFFLVNKNSITLRRRKIFSTIFEPKSVDATILGKIW